MSLLRCEEEVHATSTQKGFCYRLPEPATFIRPRHHFITMRFTNPLFTVVAALTSTATAGNMGYANILAIKGPSGGQHTETEVTVPFGQLTHYDLAISELRLASIAVTLPGGAIEPDIQDITCQMYKDEHGLDPRSREFTIERPALLSTHTIQFGWVLCYVEVEK
ncbi:hypothetical protein CEP51_005903 [Fusarium floridanum]|uniref:Uncharacterized protein n=1 Tax=Fusarium floridanum TaxID=1325733 RepID=A0A428RUZ1_9HYPO|nr:hypothetical protein CEP51_005903 [Fusarium floridanum]